MIADDIANLRSGLEQALVCGDLDLLKERSFLCDSFLRDVFPLKPGSDQELEGVVLQMESLLEIYQAALKVVHVAKDKTGAQLHALGKNKVSASKYLDVASGFSSQSPR